MSCLNKVVLVPVEQSSYSHRPTRELQSPVINTFFNGLNEKRLSSINLKRLSSLSEKGYWYNDANELYCKIKTWHIIGQSFVEFSSQLPKSVHKRRIIAWTNLILCTYKYGILRTISLFTYESKQPSWETICIQKAALHWDDFTLSDIHQCLEQNTITILDMSVTFDILDHNTL